MCIIVNVRCRNPDIRGISAAGSAPHWQCGGQEFDPPMLHHREKLDEHYVHRVFLYMLPSGHDRETAFAIEQIKNFFFTEVKKC